MRSKKQQTMAKLKREQVVRERREQKQLKRQAAAAAARNPEAADTPLEPDVAGEGAQIS
jgi:hypothetical protein